MHEHVDLFTVYTLPRRNALPQCGLHCLSKSLLCPSNPKPYPDNLLWFILQHCVDTAWPPQWAQSMGGMLRDRYLTWDAATFPYPEKLQDNIAARGMRCWQI